MKLLIAVLAAVPVLAAVDGTVINGTTGQPQAGVSINLVQPGAGGMQQLGTATSGPDGSFHFDQTPGGGGPALLQATYRDVTYTQIMPPRTPTNAVRVTVNEATADPPAGLEVQHLILLEPGAENLEISETFFARNESQLTYNDSKNGSLRFYLPAGAPASLQATIDSTGVPITRPVEKAGALHKISYPIKPGDTRVDLRYSIPATATFSGKLLSNNPPTRLVTPGTVLLSGAGIQDLGQEPSTGARVYAVSGNTFEVTIQGTGALRSTSDLPEEETGAPKCCEEAPARIYGQLPWVLGFALAILALGGALLYRRGAA